MNEKELLCRMALPLLPGIGLVGARHLIQAAGSATMLFEHARELPALLPGVTPKVATAFQHTLFCANIQPLIFSFLKVFKRQKEFAPKQRVLRGESLSVCKEN